MMVMSTDDDELDRPMVIVNCDRAPRVISCVDSHVQLGFQMTWGPLCICMHVYACGSLILER